MSKMTETQWETLRYFQPAEFVAPEYMSYQLLVRLDSARHIAGIPFRITSSFDSSNPLSSHSTGKAVDISVASGFHRFLITKALLNAGFTRIGIYDRHIHVDVDDNERPSTTIWTGTSSSKRL